jgi:hypothetical protein
MEADRSTREAKAFRTFYQVVVDATPPTGELTDLGRLTLTPRRGRPRRPALAALGAALVVLVAVGAVFVVMPPRDARGPGRASYTPFLVLGDDLPPDLIGTLHVRDEMLVEEGTVDGDPRLVPPVGTVIRELDYSSSAGSFDLISFEGHALLLSDLAAVFPGSEPVDVNGHEALLVPDGLTWFVMWTPSRDLTLGAESSELSAEQLLTIARAVESTTEAEWESLVTSNPAAGEFTPTAQSGSFEPVSQPLVLAAGEGWAAWTQVVAGSPTRPTTRTYLCAWIARDAPQSSIDLGCTDEFGGTWPAFPVPGGLVQVTVFDPAVAEVRITVDGGDPMVLTPVQPHPESPGVIIAALVPSTDRPMVLTTFDADGYQVDADPYSDRLDMPLLPCMDREGC